jgi:hypothetical protein
MNRASPITRGLLAAALILGISALLAWLTPAYLDRDTEHRLLGALLGAVVVVYANAVPKAFIARTRTRCAPAVEQAARRFTGWALVIGGIGYMAASLLAPIGISGMLAGLALGTAVVVVALRLRRMARAHAGG